MFKNKWRKTTFYIWLISIPCALGGGFLREYSASFTVLLVAGLIGSIVGLVILKVLGGEVK
ncbi:MAG: hypothetical protein J7J01_08695 [Methanophagales archaeon]|nr:hypothetical protein [Methanophagales archaeon]